MGNEPELYYQKLVATNVSWVSKTPPVEPINIKAKIRYRSPEAPATLFPEQNAVEIYFQQPQRAITPGQAVVFYQEDEVIGGGIINWTTRL